MNRPFGAVDVSANLKGAVPKAAAQKILVALSERGDLVQKICGTHTSLMLSRMLAAWVLSGKTTFFVANQANLEDVPAQKLAELETEYKKIDEANKLLSTEVKGLNSGASKCITCAYTQRSLLPRPYRRSCTH